MWTISTRVTKLVGKVHGILIGGAHVKFRSLKMGSLHEDPIPSLKFERSIVIIIRFLASACSGSHDFDGFEFFGV